MRTFLSLVILLNVVGSFMVLGQTTPKPVDCSKLDFTSSYKCCKIPPKELANAAMLKLTKPTADLKKWINSYMINKLQPLRLQNTLDLSSEASNRTLCTVSQFINKLLIEHEVMSADLSTYNPVKAMEALRKVTRDAYWIDEVMTIASDESVLQYIPPRFNKTLNCSGKRKTDPKVNVYIGLTFLIQYFQGHLYLMCEEPTNMKPALNKTCTTLRANFELCHYTMEEDSYKENKLGVGYLKGQQIREKLKAKSRFLHKLY